MPGNITNTCTNKFEYGIRQYLQVCGRLGNQISYPEIVLESKMLLIGWKYRGNKTTLLTQLLLECHMKSALPQRHIQFDGNPLQYHTYKQALSQQQQQTILTRYISWSSTQEAKRMKLSKAEFHEGQVMNENKIRKQVLGS